MLGLGMQEWIVLLGIGLVPLVGVGVVLFLVLRTRRADDPGRD